MTALLPLPAAVTAAFQSFELLQSVIDTFPDPIFVKDLSHRWIALNQGFCRLVGHSHDVLIGRSDPDFWPAGQAAIFWRFDDEVFGSGQPNEHEEAATGADGVTRTIWTRKFPMRDAAGKVTGLAGIAIDITAIKARLEEAERLKAENQEQRTIIAAQTSMLDQLAVPVIELADGVLLLPLVGAISERRAAQIMESLLESIRRTGARATILDVTGVPLMDAAVAGHLVRAIQATRLLGCESILAGIQPGIARTLVALAVDLGRVVTRQSLAHGLAYALGRGASAHRAIVT